MIIDMAIEDRCTDVEQTEFEEQCTTEYEEVCETVQQYECDDEDAAAVAPSTSYAVPEVYYFRLLLRSALLIQNCRLQY